ncbi:MAG: aldo/keto reductase [Candidatus Roizmanbacteria bacterium]|nr:aldo/keto reductase [Candidatus Roizmanbacteria bacterium]
MEYTILGKTNLKISRIGFGGWGIGGGAPVLRWKDMWKADDKLSKQSLLNAYKNGINFFDTALVYADGHSERLIKDTLGDKDIIIATKVPPLDGHWPAKNKDINKVFPTDYIIEKAKESYVNFGKKTIDLLQLHVWMDDWFDSKNWRNAFTTLKKEGIIKFVGVSINDHDPNSALKIVESGEIDTIQVIYNIFDQSPQDKLFPLAQKNNVGIIARVPLDEGSLSGTFNYETTFNDWRKYYFTTDRLKMTVNKVNEIKSKLVNEKRTMSQIALKFCISDNGADVAIVGMRNPNHATENIKSVRINFVKEELNYLMKQRWIRNFYPEDV